MRYIVLHRCEQLNSSGKEVLYTINVRHLAYHLLCYVNLALDRCVRWCPEQRVREASAARRNNAGPTMLYSWYLFPRKNSFSPYRIFR